MKVGASAFDVMVVPGQLLEEGEDVLALQFRNEILVNGEACEGGRLRGIVDQMRRRHEWAYGDLKDNAINEFCIDVFRQLRRMKGVA